jgi:hypothetical protein
MVNNKTVGRLAWDALANSKELDHSPYEQMQEQLQDYESNVLQKVTDGINVYTTNFYIVVETKKEPKLQNVIRNYFFHRMTCPTPTWDQTVYRYVRSEDMLEFLWVLPSKDTAMMMRTRFLELPEEERQLLQYVLDDADGTLLALSKKLNGEIK